MAWGKQSTPPPPPSTFIKLLPLIVLVVLAAAVAFVGYQVYLSMQQISDAAAEKLEKKNVHLTKDGVRVSVREVHNENYVDQTQSLLVKAWSLSSFPAYKSRLGWNTTAADDSSSSTSKSRRGYAQDS